MLGQVFLQGLFPDLSWPHNDYGGSSRGLMPLLDDNPQKLNTLVEHRLVAPYTLSGLMGLTVKPIHGPLGPADGVTGFSGFNFAHACFSPVFSGELTSIIFSY